MAPQQARAVPQLLYCGGDACLIENPANNDKTELVKVA
eukprot:CAMPEP_0115521460 /NCGR_PEP_ID=MMETSP0271-20121206/79557_1 /TAXON_ID=71861 /ORGANISM="Scrippsiella trochoidea, Strain CCMP3099" /LENGTH=37 /DNA_ID= /DNA_START= /DNA_END= /DNA_ORIENTATION=